MLPADLAAARRRLEDARVRAREAEAVARRDLGMRALESLLAGGAITQGGGGARSSAARAKLAAGLAAIEASMTPTRSGGAGSGGMRPTPPAAAVGSPSSRSRSAAGDGAPPSSQRQPAAAFSATSPGFAVRPGSIGEAWPVGADDAPSPPPALATPSRVSPRSPSPHDALPRSGYGGRPPPSPSMPLSPPALGTPVRNRGALHQHLRAALASDIGSERSPASERAFGIASSLRTSDGGIGNGAASPAALAAADADTADVGDDAADEAVAAPHEAAEAHEASASDAADEWAVEEARIAGLRAHLHAVSTPPRSPPTGSRGDHVRPASMRGSSSREGATDATIVGDTTSGTATHAGHDPAAPAVATAFGGAVPVRSRVVVSRQRGDGPAEDGLGAAGPASEVSSTEGWLRRPAARGSGDGASTATASDFWSAQEPPHSSVQPQPQSRSHGDVRHRVISAAAVGASAAYLSPPPPLPHGGSARSGAGSDVDAAPATRAPRRSVAFSVDMSGASAASRAHATGVTRAGSARGRTVDGVAGSSWDHDKPGSARERDAARAAAAEARHEPIVPLPDPAPTPDVSTAYYPSLTAARAASAHSRTRGSDATPASARSGGRDGDGHGGDHDAPPGRHAHGAADGGRPWARSRRGDGDGSESGGVGGGGGIASSEGRARSATRGGGGRVSNKQRVLNALAAVCLAGAHRAKELDAAVAAVAASTSEYFLILLAAPDALSYRGLYTMAPGSMMTMRIHGTGPPLLTDAVLASSSGASEGAGGTAVTAAFKYSTGGRRWERIATDSVGLTTDAITVRLR